MQSDHTKRNTFVFMGFLLLAGLLRVLMPAFYRVSESAAPMIDTAINCAIYAIYAGLLLGWIQSIWARLLPTPARRCGIAAALLMLLYLVLRLYRYRIAFTPVEERYGWYGYYLPLVLIPTLFTTSSISMSRRNGKTQGRGETALLIPALLLSALVLTNDLHFLAFRPDVAFSSFNGDSGTYTYGPVFYAAYTWVGLCVAAGVAFLIRASRKLGDWKKAAWPFLFIAMIPVLSFLFDAIRRKGLPSPYQSPEINIFCMLGVFEACIRNRLIPSNENYPGIFARMDVSAVITDHALTPVYRTSVPLDADPGQLRAALSSPVYLDADTRLCGKTIRAGSAFWTVDESELHRKNEELADANDTLALENELIEREREQIAERAAVEQRNALYAKAAREVYPAQKRIGALLAEAEPNTPAFREKIAQVLYLMAYVKRKTNFVMVEAVRDTITAEELAAAMSESAHYFSYCGMTVTVDARADRAYPCRVAMNAYDCVEAILETLCGKTQDCYVKLEKDRLSVMADCAEAPELPPLPLPVSTRLEDGQLFLTLPLGGDDA